jgi:hypothetical protein
MTIKQELEEAINFSIDALNKIDRSNGSSNVKGNSEYVLSTIHKIKNLPYQGRNLGIGDLGYTLFRCSFENILNRLNKDSINHSLSWLDALLILLDFGNYEEIKILEFANKVNDNIIFNHILKHIISNCVVLKDIEMAEKLIPHFKPTFIIKEDANFDKGYLILLQYFSILGDDKFFFKYFKLSKPAINKYEINEAKEHLVKNYTKKNGIEPSIALCRHKNLGNKFYFNALMSFVEEGKYQELKQIFKKHSELKQPELHIELKILTQARRKAKALNLAIDDDFEELFEINLKVDRKIKWGDLKLQDVIFLDLGLSSQGNKERMIRCRKAIKYNWLKTELIIN